VFQDYDAVIVRPESLSDLYEPIRYSLYDRDNNRNLTSQSGEIISEVNKKRREQVNGLLQRGGIVVSFLEPLKKYRYELRYEGEDYWPSVTNYDWLLSDFTIDSELGGILYGTGTSIEYIDSGHPFSEYLYTKPSWTAYINVEDCKSWKIIASTYDTHALALAKRVGVGNIILLPSFYHYDNGELLERCIIKLLGDKDTTLQPEWAKAISVPGQEEIFTQITQINEQLTTLENERDSLIDSENKLERWKYLLYEKGKHKLEPVVREAFNLFGCHIEDQPDKDSDGIVSCNIGSALLEVVGSKSTIKIEKFGELTKNIGNYISEKGSSVSGILVANPFCEKPLDNRPPKNSQKSLFAKELVESAEKQGIPVLLTTDLYEVVCSIMNNEITDKDKLVLQERIFNGKGLVRLV
jgi:hypothetical protein